MPLEAIEVQYTSQKTIAEAKMQKNKNLSSDNQLKPKKTNQFRNIFH